MTSMTSKTIASILLASLLSGCMVNDSSNGSMAVDDPDPPSLDLQLLRLEGCRDILTRLYDPTSEDEGYGPSGWEYEDENIAETTYYAAKCDRFAFQDLDRSDISLVIEGHRGPTMPQECVVQADSDISPWIIVTIVVADEGIYQALYPFFGDLIRLGYIETSLMGQPHNSYSVSWGIDSMAENELTVEFTGASLDDEPFPLAHSFFWENETHLNLMRWSTLTADSSLDNFPVQGTISPPHRNPNPSGDEWVGLGDYATTNVEGTFKAFEDHQCTEPTSS